MFKIVEGNPAQGKLSANPDGIVFEVENTTVEVPWSQVEELNLVDGQYIKKLEGGVFGTLGVLMAGPIGAAIGLGFGALTRECFFHVKTSDHNFVAKGMTVLFNKMHKIFMIKKLTQEG